LLSTTGKIAFDQNASVIRICLLGFLITFMPCVAQAQEPPADNAAVNSTASIEVAQSTTLITRGPGALTLRLIS
jgi:hypothetical protein